MNYKNGVVGYNVYYYKDDDIKTITKITIGDHYNENKKHHRCLVYGSDRRLEIVLNIGRKCGLNFHDISQKYGWL